MPQPLDASFQERARFHLGYGINATPEQIDAINLAMDDLGDVSRLAEVARLVSSCGAAFRRTLPSDQQVIPTDWKKAADWRDSVDYYYFLVDQLAKGIGVESLNTNPLD